MDSTVIAELAELEQQIDFRTVAEDAPVMLWLTNNTGENIFSNTIYKTFLGRENNEQLSGEAWLDALHPDDKKECLTIFERAFRIHKSFEMEYRLKRHDGEYRYILDRGEPYIDRNGKFAGFIGSSTDITNRKVSEDELKRSHAELIQYNHEMGLINQLNSYLQVCRSLSETYPVICHYSEQIFPDWAGTLYLYNDNKTLVEVATHWGDSKSVTEVVIEPDDSWALRQGKVHNALDVNDRLLCNHVDKDVGPYLSTPVLAQGEMLGVLHMEYNGELTFESDEEQQRYFDSRERLMKTAADNLALSLVSLKLREALKNQSIRDPLTKIYNRRYMEETLEREVARCERSEQGLGVIIVDIDFFKKFNDTYGHDAGDAVLVEFAKFMTKSFRKSDIVCRFGGEEFVAIMPMAAESLVVERANQLCHRLHDLEIFYDGKQLPKITASFGVAHLNSSNYDKANMVVKLADTALYEAKRNGRDQVVLYDPEGHAAGEQGVKGSGYVKELKENT